jgi:hypothetical protein
VIEECLATCVGVSEEAWAFHVTVMEVVSQKQASKTREKEEDKSCAKIQWERRESATGHEMSCARRRGVTQKKTLIGKLLYREKNID